MLDAVSGLRNSKNIPQFNLIMTSSVPTSTTLLATNSPLLLISSPGDGQPANGPLVFRFSEPIVLGSGMLEITGTDNTIYRVTIGADTNLTVAGDTLTWVLPQRLDYGVSYRVYFSAGAIRDADSNAAAYVDMSTPFFSASLSPVAVNLTGSAQNDTLHGSDLADTIDGRDGADTIHGHGGDDVLIGGGELPYDWHQDTISGGDGNDTLYGGSGPDTLMGDAGNDMLHGGSGADYLYGGDGDDRLEGGDGNDYLNEQAGRNLVFGGAGNDMLFQGDEANGTYDGGDGDDIIHGAGGATYLGGAGNDRIQVSHNYAKTEPTVVDGGAGDDLIELETSTSTRGQITLAGGAGNDTWLIRGGTADGVMPAVITDFVRGDQIDLRQLHNLQPGANPFADGSVRLLASGADTLVQARSPAVAGTYITLVALQGVRLEQLTGADFVDGFDPRGGATGVQLTGTAGNDVLRGGGMADTLLGLGGDDGLYGAYGDDLLDGGDGNDALDGDDGSDTLRGGAGNDQLDSSRAGTNLLDGGAGNDTLRGGDGNDTLLGGAGDDKLSTNIGQWAVAGSTIVFDGGDGNDTLTFNRIDRPTSVTARGGAGADRFVFNAHDTNITLLDVSAEDKIDVANLLPEGLNGNPFGAAGYLKAVQEGADVRLYIDLDGAAGSVHGFTGLARLANMMLATLGPAYFMNGYDPSGSSSGVTLTGTPGKDVLVGAGLNDTIDGGDGADTIEGHGGNDVLRGGDETVLGAGDTISGGAGDDTIDGGAGNDTLKGDAGKDALYGGAGDDVLDGGEGDDVLEGGDGNDVLSDFQGTNTLRGGAGNDRLSSSGWAVSGAIGGSVLDGGAGDDTLFVGANASSAIGGAGNDTFEIATRFDNGPNVALQADGGDGDDTFLVYGYYSETRKVTITGGAGVDHYAVSGEGATLDLTITDFRTGAGGDVLDLFQAFPFLYVNPFGSGHARLVQDGTRTLLQVDRDGSAGPGAFGTWIAFENTTASAFTSGNFTQGVRPDGASTGLVFEGTAGDELLTGGRLDDVLRGHDGADTINGMTGNDVIEGGAGDDSLQGGGGTDRLDGGAGDDILLSQDGDDVLYGGAGNDRLNSGSGNDMQDGGDGNDVLEGGVGNDLLHGGAGRDSVLYQNYRSNVVVRAEGQQGSWSVLDTRANQDGHDLLDGVERLRFYDGGLALDVDGVAAQAWRIYRAAFDRAPDEKGLGYWIATLDNGHALATVARGFVESQEFRDLYGAAPTHAGVITLLYNNVLDRAPDAGGLAYWVEVLDSGRDNLAGVLASFSESAENVQAVAQLIGQGIAYQPWGADW
jgi:Ca2+-binding RTX toxin-like protein